MKHGSIQIIPLIILTAIAAVTFIISKNVGNNQELRGKAQSCFSEGTFCLSNPQGCCSGLYCANTTCIKLPSYPSPSPTPKTCLSEGTYCQNVGESCCSGLTCQQYCKKPTTPPTSSPPQPTSTPICRLESASCIDDTNSCCPGLRCDSSYVCRSTASPYPTVSPSICKQIQEYCDQFNVCCDNLVCNNQYCQIKPSPTSSPILSPSPSTTPIPSDLSSPSDYCCGGGNPNCKSIISYSSCITSTSGCSWFCAVPNPSPTTTSACKGICVYSSSCPNGYDVGFDQFCYNGDICCVSAQSAPDTNVAGYKNGDSCDNNELCQKVCPNGIFHWEEYSEFWLLDKNGHFVCGNKLIDGNTCKVSTQCENGCCTLNDNSILTCGNCNPITETITGRQISLDELAGLRGKSCDSILVDTIYFGEITDKDGTIYSIQLYCNGSTNRVTVDYWFISAKPQENELVCQNDKVVHQNNVSNPIQVCGYQQNPNNPDSIINAMPLCHDGHCMQTDNDKCDKASENLIVPNTTNPGNYVQCRQGIWQPFAENMQFDWSTECPNSYKDGYLKTIASIQNTLMPNQKSLPINCYESYSDYAGAEYFSGPTQEYPDGTVIKIDFACGNPVEQSYWCQYVVIHEFTHGFHDAHPGIIENYSKTIECIENPNPDLRGTYQFLGKEKPVSDYGYTNCNEALAEAVSIYKTNPCSMKESYPIQYQWITENIFNNQDECTNTINLCLKNSIKNTCTETPGCQWHPECNACTVVKWVPDYCTGK